MTLCIAWKELGRIRFASDSRLYSNWNAFADVGIKVLEIPIKIFSAVENKTGTQSVLYEYNAGFCWAGTSLSAYLFKESIQQIVSHLQFAPMMGAKLSFAGVCEVIQKYLAAIIKKLIKGFKVDMGFRFFIAGFCPLNNRVQAFKFWIEGKKTNPVVNFVEVIKNNNDVDYIGDDPAVDLAKKSIDKMKRRLKTLRWKDVFPALQKACKDRSIPSVGGELQFGEFEGGDFQVKGITYTTLKKNGMLKFKAVLRGLQVYDDKSLQLEPFHLSFRLSDITQAIAPKKVLRMVGQ